MAPGSGVGFVVFGGLAVAAGAVFLIARSASASTPPKFVAVPTPGLTPQQIAEIKAHPSTRTGPGAF
jgi:hypothetical protein